MINVLFSATPYSAIPIAVAMLPSYAPNALATDIQLRLPRAV
jgi:hypothetical protein